MLHFQSAGSAFERGYGHGQRFSGLIHEHIAQYQLPARWDREKALAVERIQTNLKGHLPDLLEESAGIAEGAEVSLQEILALNYWIEVLQATVGFGCSLVGFTRSSSEGVLLGKNSDHDLAAVRYLALQRVTGREEEGSLPFLRGTFVGTTSTRAGINAAGLAVCGAALVPQATNWEGVPVMALIGRILSHCASVEEAIDLACALPPINYGANIMVADRDGAVVVIERLPDGFAVRYPENGVIFNTNHCVATETAGRTREEGALVQSSRQRFQKLETLIPTAERTSAGLHTLFSDHTQPGAICQHGAGGWYTCAAYLLLPNAGKMWVADGSPCAADFLEYGLE